MESVTTSNDDPANPEVLVPGVGRYKLNTLKQNLREKFEALFNQVDSDDPEQWDKAQWMLNNEAMHVMMDTVKRAHDEMRKR